jgi:hypothetical protein
MLRDGWAHTSAFTVQLSIPLPMSTRTRAAHAERLFCTPELELTEAKKNPASPLH